ncbi:cobalamin B12-binding domain-containing protein [Sporomusa sp. KB1]|jgi:methylmalonyl-CoA mutase C-terminal domain/subunit|uniref:cobalamin B12-binding domain-containing protein n=1 Tax=Sporomusa sp. KB1 TaxID=943346 RepID=UPI0011A6D565|nr:cobalamin-dependent protein [Sporomusa sp. KB1]TWH45515.1 methylmalonyl-CoA mutase C-terminal domain/subunit [Sporomusa sp. KB1]
MRKIRVLVAKVGCDIHERGALTMLTVFRDAGMETIYTGRFQTEEGVVNAAITENVDVVCVSDLTGSLVIICRKIVDGLKKQGSDDIYVVCGGIITDQDRIELKEMGVAGAFGTGYPPEETVGFIQELVKDRLK